MALDAHHANARKLVLTVNEQLQALESGQDTSVGLQSLISQNLNALAREVQELEGLLAAVAPGSRGLWRKKITQLTDESASLRHALGKYASSRSAQQRELEERLALLAGGRGGGEHAIDINGFAAHESRRLHESDSAIDGLTGNATAVLDQLGQQRGALKGVHKRVLDLATTLGVSNSVMKMIERRQFLDKLLVYGGMLAVLALLWFVHRVPVRYDGHGDCPNADPSPQVVGGILPFIGADGHNYCPDGSPRNMSTEYYFAPPHGIRARSPPSWVPVELRASSKERVCH